MLFVSEVTEELIEDIEDLVVPEDAEKEIDKVIKDLNGAIDGFNKGKPEKAFDKLSDAVKHLTKAEKKGADTQDIIDDLITFAQDMVNEKITEAEQYAGTKKVDKELEKFDKELASAQADLDHTKKDGTPEPKYAKAIEHYLKAWEHAQKAVKHGMK